MRHCFICNNCILLILSSIVDYLVGEEGAGCFDFRWFVACVLYVLVCLLFLLVSLVDYPVSILYKSIAGRYRPVSCPDGPIMARYRFIKNAIAGLFSLTEALPGHLNYFSTIGDNLHEMPVNAYFIGIIRKVFQNVVSCIFTKHT